MTETQRIVSLLLEDDDFKEKAYNMIRAPLTERVFDFGFELGTSDSDMIEAVALDVWSPMPINWEELGTDIQRIERNFIAAALSLGINLLSEGHSDNGSLVGSGSVKGTAKGWYVIATLAKKDEPLSTSSGTMPSALTETLFDGVSKTGRAVIDVVFGIFDKQEIVDFVEQYPLLDS